MAAEARSPPRRRVHVESGARHATWLELFFDLVYVVAVSRLALLLLADHSLVGAATYVGLFTVIWWSWISFSYFADLFDDDGPLDRLAQLAAMLAIIVVAVSLDGGVSGDAGVFAGAFAAMFALLGGIYLHVGWRSTSAPVVGLCRYYVVGSWIGAAGWAISIAIPAPARYWLWGVTVVLNAAISGPIAYARVREAPRQVSHMPERFGLFTIVVLGEAVLSVVAGTELTDGGWEVVTSGGGGFAIAAAIWWVYFDAFDEGAIDHAIAGGRGAQVRSFLYGYGHLIIYASIAAAGVGIELAIEEVVNDGEPPISLAFALAGVLAGFVAISTGVGRRGDVTVLGAKAATALTGLLAAALLSSPTAAVAVTAAAWVALAALEWHQRESFARPRARTSDGHRPRHELGH